MSLEVDFITLGDASERLGMPSATLRHWSDQLEELEIHYLLRNNRNERIYFDTDIKVFEFMRDLKKEYGRRTTTKDIAYMIVDRAKEDELSLRSKEDAPLPSNPSNRTSDLLNQEDIKRLMDSERVKQFIGIVVSESTKSLRDDLVLEVRNEVKNEMNDSLRKIEEANERSQNLQLERHNQLTQLIRLSMEKKQEEKKGLFAKWFGR